MNHISAELVESMNISNEPYQCRTGRKTHSITRTMVNEQSDTKYTSYDLYNGQLTNW
jgi:hypothetical protein